MLDQGRVGFDSTMALEMSMEWDWPGDELRRPQLDKFSVRRCEGDGGDLGTLNAEQNELLRNAHAHSLTHAHRSVPAEKKEKNEKREGEIWRRRIIG